MNLRFSFMIIIQALAFIMLLSGVKSCAFEEDNQMIYDETAIIERRKDIDEFFTSDPSSPLTEQQKESFKGLSYFAPNEEYAFFAKFSQSKQPDTVLLLTSKGSEKRPMLRYGTFTFQSQDANTYTLTAFTSLSKDDGILFIPFKDQTNGFDTYEAGRYLELEEVQHEDEYLLDFNRAYNPYCAYNKQYTCPLVPKENVLSMAMKAGEKRPINQ